MNATLERLTAEFVQLIGPAASAPTSAATPPAGTPAATAISTAPTAATSAASDNSRAGLRPALPVTSPAPLPVAATAAPSAPAASVTAATAASAKPIAAGAAGTAPKPPAPPAPPAPPPSPVQVVDHALKGFHFDATVAPDQVVDAAKILDRAGFGIDAVTGVDWLAQGQMEVVYDYFHPTQGLRAVVRARVNRADPAVATISTVFPGANWHERETHDFFGIRFTGHPNLKPFLLPEDANFHPLRKDYQP